MQVQFQSTRSSANGAILILLWIYFLAGPFILTQDLPVHIYSGKIMSALLFSAGGIYSEWFEFSPDFISNSFTQWAAVIPSWFISPYWIHRIFLLWMVTAGFRGIKAMLKTYAPEQESMAALLLPFFMPVLFLKGFSNFFFGIAFALHAFSMIPELLKGKLYKPFLWYSLLIVSCHPMVLYFFTGMSACIIGLYKVPETVVTVQQRLKGLAHILPAMVGGILLSQSTQPLSWVKADAALLWEQLSTMQYWKWYLPHEQEVFQVLLGVGALLTLLSVYYTRNPVSLLFSTCAVLLFILYFYAPSGREENLYIHDRVLVLMSICLVTGLALSEIPAHLKKVLRYLFLFAFAFLLWSRYEIQQKIEEDWKEIKSAVRKIPEGSVVLPLVHDHQGEHPAQVGIFLHVLSSCTEKSIVFLDHYAAHTHYFPVRWKSGRDPYLQLGDSWEAQPPSPDWNGVKKLTVNYMADLFPPQEFYREGTMIYQSRVIRIYQVP